MSVSTDSQQRSAPMAGNVAEYSSVYGRSITDSAIQGLHDYLDHCGPTTTLVLLLRISSEFLRKLQICAPGDWDLDGLIHNSLLWQHTEDGPPPLQTLRRCWHESVGADSLWSDVVEFHGIHGGALRGPVNAFHRLLDHELIRTPSSPIAAVIRPVPTYIPEFQLSWARTSKHDRIMADHLEEVGRQLKEAYSEEGSKRIPELVERPDFVAALDWFQSVRSMMFPGPVNHRGRLDRLFQLVGQTGLDNADILADRYLDGLGIGSVTSFGPNAGAGEKVCILDSGADESHPALQQQIAYYVHMDRMAQEKEAYACIDTGCHGTKMASVIAGRNMSLLDLGLNREYLSRHHGLDSVDDSTSVRTGIAPGSKLFVVGVLNGDPLAETGGVQQVAAGFNWVGENYRNGYSVVTVSIEPDPEIMDPGTKRALEGVVGILRQYGIATVVCAGNSGPGSIPIATNACVVGAATRQGIPSPKNGSPTDLLATGIDVLCGQPRLPTLGNHLIDVYSGSSISTAIVAGAIVALKSSRPNRSAIDVLDALISTAGPTGMISLNKAQSIL